MNYICMRYGQFIVRNPFDSRTELFRYVTASSTTHPIPREDICQSSICLANKIAIAQNLLEQ